MRKRRTLPAEVQARLNSAAAAEASVRLAALADALATTMSGRSGSQALREFAATIKELEQPSKEAGTITASEVGLPGGATLH